MKKNILCVLLGIIVASVVVFAATTISADQIEYDENTTVKDKIDDLYTKTKTLKLVAADIYLDSTHSSTYSTTVDLSSYANHNNFTTDDFIIALGVAAPASTTSGRIGDNASISKSYNPNTGILTLSINEYKYNGIGVWLQFSVYLYK